MCSCSNSCPNNIQAFKPAVCGCFIPNAPPDPLLAVKAGLIRRQILQMKAPMSLQELQNGLSAMPAGSIHIQKYPITSKLFVERFQDLKKAFAVAFGCSNKTVSTQKRRHPSRDIEPLGMLARGRDFQANTFLCPASAQSGMKRKPGLILKNDRLFRPQISEFFLKPARIDELGSSWPEDKRDRRVSIGNPTGASTSGLDGPSERFQSVALNESQASVHPTESLANQTGREIVPSARLVPGAPLPLNEPDVQDGVLVPKLSNQFRLPRESSGLSSCASIPGLLLSKRDVGLPKQAGVPRSLFRSKLLEFGLPGPPNAPVWLRGARVVRVYS